MAMTDYLCFTAKETNCTIALKQYGTVSWTGSYSTDGSTWTTYTLGTSINLTNVGDKVYFKGTLTADQSSSNYLQFSIFDIMTASGNVMSLTHESDFTTRTELSYAYEFYDLFDNCDIVSAPELPATTLTDHCYYSMFYGCTGLTKTPELPATTLATYCYYYMFYGCNGLQYPPELPATTLTDYCYSGMFQDCSKLWYNTSKAGNYTQEYRIPSSGTGTAGTNSLRYMFSWSTPCINTTIYMLPPANKVIYRNKTLIDLTSDTITADSLKKGYYAYDKSGHIIAGTLVDSIPSAGTLITMDLGSTAVSGANNVYRIISTSGTQAKVMAMYDIKTSAVPSNTSSTPILYAGSALDTLLNTTFYNSLNDTAKAAIIPKDIQQSYITATTSQPSSYVLKDTQYSTTYYFTANNLVNIGSRYVYALDITDLSEYKIAWEKYEKIAFIAGRVYPNYTSEPWLRSIDNSNQANWFQIKADQYSIESRQAHTIASQYSTARPAFVIDLAKVNWSISS